MKLETDRLILRGFEEGDWQAVHDYASDPEVVRYVEWGPNTEEESKNYIQVAISHQQEQPRRIYNFALILKAEKRLIGCCIPFTFLGDNDCHNYIDPEAQSSA